ncbi:DUF7681 family protein [Actinoplanes sp. NPDC049316]|uniref:Acb2/Tad1 domain-containing protein n=1 Tax=Actinoplanes sp. NPDC049316 TaxID=3154727 RepID=UPI003428F179
MDATTEDVYAQLTEAQRIELDRRFDHHPPADEETAARHARWRAEVKHLAAVALRELPSGRETSLVLTALDDVLWCGTAAIARPPMRGARPAA